MPGRYDFSLPEPPPRDGWFKIGTLDVTTTAMCVGLAIVSLFVYAASPEFLFKGAFESSLVREGQVWRLFLHPVVNPPVPSDSLIFLWIIIRLVFFWWIGHQIEEQVGRKPFTVLLVVMAAVPALIVSLIDTANPLDARWSAYSFGLITFALALLVVFAMDHPQVRAIFNLPLWVFAAGYIGIEILRLVGERRWAQLMLTLLTVAVAFIGSRQLGLLAEYSFFPAFGNYSSGSTGPYERAIAAQRRAEKKPKGRKRGKGRTGGGTVVAGPWAEPSGPSRLEQAELDVLLDKISAGGIDSLNALERKRLNELSKKMRGS